MTTSSTTFLFVRSSLHRYSLGSSRKLYGRNQIFDPIFPVSEIDSFGKPARYKLGQLFWGRYQNNDAQLSNFHKLNTCAPTTAVSAGFQHPSQPASTRTAQHEQLHAVNSISPDWISASQESPDISATGEAESFGISG